MNIFKVIVLGVACCALGVRAAESAGEPNAAEMAAKLGYHIYAGNTHAHTSFTWSHGDQWVKLAAPAGEKEPGIYVDPRGAQFPAKSMVLKDDWEKHQGPPARHYELAKAGGYDFYICTDHSQEADLQPPDPANLKWAATKKAAGEASDEKFVAIAGYEHSENNGPKGTGHLNVFNSDGYLNAMAAGNDLPSFYKWLKTAAANGQGPVVASFNHPGAHQYNDWDYRDDVSDPDVNEAKDRITKIDIMKDGGVVVETYSPPPAHGVKWKVTIRDGGARYFFVRVWNAGGGDGPGADGSKAVAWLAPVWIARGK